MRVILKKMKKDVAMFSKRVYLALHIGCDNNLLKNRLFWGMELSNRVFENKVKNNIDNEMELSKMIFLPDKGIAL